MRLDRCIVVLDRYTVVLDRYTVVLDRYTLLCLVVTVRFEHRWPSRLPPTPFLEARSQDMVG